MRNDVKLIAPGDPAEVVSVVVVFVDVMSYDTPHSSYQPLVPVITPA